MTLRLHAPLPLRPVVLWLSRLLIVLGLVGLGVYLWSEADRWIYQWLNLDEFESPKPLPAISAAPLPKTLGPATAPATAVNPMRVQIDPGIIGQIEISKLGVKALVRRGIDSTTLRRSVGHVPGTALPGENGNSVLAGHRDTFFAALKGVQRGDVIRVRLRAGRTADYRVDHLAIVGRDAVDVMATSPEARLTLITCYPFDFIGPSPRRFVVGAAALKPSPNH